MTIQPSVARISANDRPSASDAAGAGGRIVARGVSRRFGAKTALEPCDIDIGPGITGLLGPNGSGKSTLLRILVGLVKAHTGSVSIAGVDLTGDGASVRRVCTYAPGEVAVYGEMRAREHLGWLLRGRERSARARAVEIASALGLPLAQRVRGYSHGMKRQLLFAAALAPEVPVRIFDEPSEGLDPSKRSQIIELLRLDARAGRTILLSSHHLGEVDRICDHLVFMSSGRKIADENAGTFQARAKHFLRLRFPPTADMQTTARVLTRIAGAPVSEDGFQITVRLQSDDPRAFLAAVCTSRELVQPSEIDYGQMPLSALYRELYDVEVC